MKTVPVAPDLKSAYLSQGELSAIYSDVLQSLDLSRSSRNVSIALASDGDAVGGAALASPPATNRGGKSGERQEVIGARLVLHDGKVLEIPARRTWGGSSAFIDWVNFTTDESDYFDPIVAVSDDEVVSLVSAQMESIFGYGITQMRDTGANFYQRSYVLGDGYGMVCHGGQRNTVLVMVSGQGCDAAKEGWQERLFDFLYRCRSGRAKLTRVDLAHDDYDGSRYSVDKADQAYDAGLFNCGGRNPDHEYRGNWKRPNGKGRTLYVGSRKNGKFCRVYEKGRELGDPNSEWCRVEVEFKSVDRELPLEMLLEPGQYLAAAYPALSWISEVQHRILTIQKKLEISYDFMVRCVKTQFGKALWVMLQMEKSAEKVLSMVSREGFPDRLKLPMWQESEQGMHQSKPVQMDRKFFDQMALA